MQIGAAIARQVSQLSLSPPSFRMLEGAMVYIIPSSVEQNAV